MFLLMISFKLLTILQVQSISCKRIRTYLLVKLHKYQLLEILLKYQEVLIILEDVVDLAHVKEEEKIEAGADDFTHVLLVEVISSVLLRLLLPFQCYQHKEWQEVILTMGGLNYQQRRNKVSIMKEIAQTQLIQ